MDDQEVFERRIGTVLRDKWRLERLLGVGGMAAVYLGVHKIGRSEAIKILHPEIARSADLRARFEREARAVNQLRHPGVVEIRDIDTTEDGAPFLVMELLEGESLNERARRLGGLPADEVLRTVDELLDVLAIAHDAGIIHRDVKPDNVFILEDERIKVLDFGIARIREGAGGFKTRTGAMLGTTAYMPPEQVKGEEIDGRADLFAVGAMMFRLAARSRVHEAQSESDLLVKMATQPARSLASVAPELSEGFCAIVDRALAFQRGRRYPDARTMQLDVRAMRRGEAPPFATARLAEGDLPGSLASAGVISSSADTTRAESVAPATRKAGGWGGASDAPILLGFEPTAAGLVAGPAAPAEALTAADSAVGPTRALPSRPGGLEATLRSPDGSVGRPLVSPRDVLPISIRDAPPLPPRRPSRAALVAAVLAALLLAASVGAFVALSFSGSSDDAELDPAAVVDPTIVAEDEGEQAAHDPHAASAGAVSQPRPARADILPAPLRTVPTPAPTPAPTSPSAAPRPGGSAPASPSATSSGSAAPRSPSAPSATSPLPTAPAPAPGKPDKEKGKGKGKDK